MKVIKNSGDIVAYDKAKLRKSLQRSGISEADLAKIMKTVEAYIYEGIKTKQIYKFAKRLLKNVSASHAARYNLRSALQELGPAGFFFEKFIALIFTSEGYQAKTNITLQGSCVSHEVDVIVKKHGQTAMVECKFHAGSAAVSDVKIPMYILSRFNDLKAGSHTLFAASEKLSGCKIVTNNRFTTDAQVFARCSGLELLSWDYPENDCLRTKIDQQQLYPVTCLMTLSAIEKEKLLIMDIILVRQLLDATEALAKIGISDLRKKRILNEAAGLCNIFTQ